jgi:drug/metabolite transporter (DMT)-like permease
MTPVVLALVSSMAYGLTDFMGGLASRRAHVLVVGMVTQPVGLLMLVPLVVVTGGVLSTPALVLGALSGVGGAVAYVLLFRSLAIGPMSIASPLSALMSAILPVVAGVLFGERLTGVSIVGIVLGLVAVLLVSREHEDTPHPVTARVVVMALLAGVFISVFFIALERAPDDSGLWPLVIGRAVTAVCLVGAALVMRVVARPPGTVLRLGLGAAFLDVTAAAAFLLATRVGMLSIVAVITALYPAATMLMARVVLHERLQLVQKVGLGLAAGSVVILALS